MSDKIGALRVYWRLYGGIYALFGSIYIYISISFTTICFPFWSNTENSRLIWPDTALAILPSLLAFSLGGMTILLAFSNPRFLRSIQGDGDPSSLYMKATATMFHFIVVQTASIFAAILCKAYTSLLLSAIGFFLMTYSVMFAVAAASVLIMMARIFNAQAGGKKDGDKDE